MSPRSFTEHERESIRQLLYEKGKEFIKTYGVKKTSIADITNAAGVAKGTFYLFFRSKEEFFFDLFEQEEARVKAKYLDIMSSKENIEETLRKSLKGELISNDSFLYMLKKQDIDYLMRGLPSERTEKHILSDDDAITIMMQKAGIDQSVCDPRVLSNLTRLLFLLPYSEDIINQDVYIQTGEVLIDAIIHYAFGKDKKP